MLDIHAYHCTSSKSDEGSGDGKSDEGSGDGKNDEGSDDACGRECAICRDRYKHDRIFQSIRHFDRAPL